MAEASRAACGRIYTIAPHRPFLDALAGAVLAGDLPHPGGAAPAPLDLPRATILLPTRRAARALNEAFLRHARDKALLLPVIRPIAADEDEAGLIGAMITGPDHAVATLPPAISGLERLVVLTRLVLAWSKARAQQQGAGTKEEEARLGTVTTPAQAVRLAAELARLMDAVETENVSLQGLSALVADDGLAAHWQLTLEFLAILTGFWPAHLAERGLLSPMERRNRQLRVEAERLQARPPSGPVIVAGVTGSIPAAAELMAAVTRLELGAIVLPALDLAADAATFALVAEHPEHPQHGLARLLGALGVERQSVRELPEREPRPVRAGRQAIVREAMRPAETTASWHLFAGSADLVAVDAALAGLTVIEAPTADDEAEVAALVLREAVETPGRTAALVTPDRVLARRAIVRLESMGLRVDDSAGRPLAKTMPGAFLDLVVSAAASAMAPVPTMALLKHPLTRLGLAAGPVRRAARALEIAAFRAPYLGRGLAGIAAALAAAEAADADGERRHRALGRMGAKDRAAVRDLAARLTAAMTPLTTLFEDTGAHTLSALARAHIVAAEALAAVAAGEDSGLWRGEAGEAAGTLLAGLLDPALPELPLDARDYPEVIRGLLAAELVRPRVPAHPRVFVWGPMEARLLQPDVVILGGLNEGTWPAIADPGPWLNRAMRKTLGLPSPDEATGRAAHDFATLTGAPAVYLTRAKKVDGVPTVPSRWLMRLDSLLGGADRAAGLRRGGMSWLALARRRDHAAARAPAPRPAPRPPLALRPRRLSVSAVERWIANPYVIFAQHVLGLDAMPALGPAPDAALRGSIVHAVLARFAAMHPTALPADTAGCLDGIAAEVMRELAAHPRIAAFWRPRLARFAAWFAETEPARRAGITRVHAEIDGRRAFATAGSPFTLTARADRIDERAGGIIITDYKTGSFPRAAAVLSGRSPQLPLEAAIAEDGGFDGLGAQKVAGLRYIRAGGGTPAGEELTIAGDRLAEGVGATLAGLLRLIARFDDPATPYLATQRSGFESAFDDYAHLARFAEWAADAGDGED